MRSWSRSPNAIHADVAVAAATAGKHVLVDKPMACTTDDADAMIAAADAHGVVLVPFHNTRFVEPFVAARQFVAAGRLGEVTGSALRSGTRGRKPGRHKPFGSSTNRSRAAGA